MSGPLEVVGREEELGLVREFAAREGFAALVLEGEAGIGKTTLWREAVALASEGGARVLVARPAAAEARLAFAGLGDLLAGVLDEVVAELPAPQAAALEVALLRREAEGRPADARTVSAAVLSALRTLARGSPLVVAVDDVQWLDSGSAAALVYALRRLGEEPVRLVTSLRLDPVLPPSVLLENLSPEVVTRVPVAPLSMGALHRAIRLHLGRTLPRPVLQHVHELAGGNPFYALELVRSLPEDPRAGFALPPSLEGLTRERLGRLPTAVRRLLEPAALVADPAVDLLEALSPQPARVGERLDEAVAAGVIEISGGSVRFTHPLLAEGMAATIGPRRRVQLHAQLADLIGEPEQRAHHLALATTRPDAPIAAEIEAGAHAAAARGATAAAAELTAAAASLTPAGDHDGRRRRGLQEAEYAMESGDTPRARTVLEGILAGSPSGRPRAEILTSLARVHFNGLDWRSSVDLLREASLEVDEDFDLRAQIELHLALNLDLLRTDVPATLAHAQAAVRLAERVDDAAVLAEALALQAKSEFLLGGAWPGELIDRALTLEPAMAALPPDRWPSDYLASMLSWTDELPAAMAGLERVQVLAEEYGDEVSHVWALARSAEVKCHAGMWQAALHDVGLGHEIALQAGQTANQAMMLAAKAFADAHLGSTDSARLAGEEAIELAERSGAVLARRIALAALGFLELSLGQQSEAHRHLAPLSDEMRAAGIREPGAMRFLQDEIEALVAIERISEAKELLRFLQELADATQRATALGAAARCRGLVAGREGRHAAALAALEEALAHHDSSRSLTDRATMAPHEHRCAPGAFERGRTLLHYGVALRRAKRKREARERLQAALAIFEELGARVFAERTRDELARIGGRAPTDRALTPSEQQIASLVAQGKTNKQVAAELYITSRTVEGNLTRIYTKLGVRSRTELAARFKPGGE